jgi:hypothetical protein
LLYYFIRFGFKIAAPNGESDMQQNWPQQSENKSSWAMMIPRTMVIAVSRWMTVMLKA